MFSTLRQGASVYILNKGKNPGPSLKIGQVEYVSAPQSKISGMYATNVNDMVVDIKVKIDNDTIDFQKIPISLSSAPIGDIIICDNRDDMITEIRAFKQTCQNVISNYSYYEQGDKACDEMLAQLSPEIAKDQERDKAIDKLKGEISDIKEEFRGAVSEIKNLFTMYMQTPRPNANQH